MRFICFGYINETDWENLTRQEQQEIMHDYFSFYQQLKAKNKFWGGTGLISAKEACKLSLVDNAVKETNLKLDVEQLGGFFFLEADSLEEAKAIVVKHPGLKVGAFEIRIVDEEITEMVGAN
jgi:hypothetical protein